MYIVTIRIQPLVYKFMYEGCTVISEGARR